jgi:hypothetical protein
MTWRAVLPIIAAALANTPAEAAAAPDADADVKQPPARTGADERFVPSEDISEDLSVSFPSDI